MNIDDYIAVGGKPGLFKMVNNKNSGLVLEDIKTGKKRFYSAMRHQFTPLGTISIYTMMDSEPLNKVFQNMLDQLEDNPPPAHKSKPDLLFEYFEDVLPQFDNTKVNVGDIRKIIKWFEFLREEGLLSGEEE
jgi:hypothetical protein